MADYYTNFSLALRLPDAAAQSYALNLAEQACQSQFENEVPADFPAELLDHLEDWLFEVVAQTVDEHPGLWLHSQNGGVDPVCALLQHLLTKFDPAGVVTFEWSHDCSKPRVDAYGGGAAVVTTRKIKTLSTSQWLQQQTAALARPRKPARSAPSAP